MASSCLTVGCNHRVDSQPAVVVTRQQFAERSEETVAADGPTTQAAPPEVDNPATRADLEEYLKIFKGEGNWTFGERTPGELAGTWTPDDRSDARQTFNVDGVDGAFSQTSYGLTVRGVYAISETGKVVAAARGGGIFLGTHARLQDGRLVGPKGPNPKLTWRRQEPVPAADAPQPNPR